MALLGREDGLGQLWQWGGAAVVILVPFHLFSTGYSLSLGQCGVSSTEHGACPLPAARLTGPDSGRESQGPRGSGSRKGAGAEWELERGLVSKRL